MELIQYESGAIRIFRNGENQRTVVKEGSSQSCCCSPSRPVQLERQLKEHSTARSRCHSCVTGATIERMAESEYRASLDKRYETIDSKEYYLKSNGFGQFVQTIILRVAVADCEAIARRLGIKPEADVTDPMFAKLRWKRPTNRRRDDNEVVFELHRELSDFAEALWSIDWRASEY